MTNKDAAAIAFLSDSVDIFVTDWIWVSKQRYLGNKVTFLPYSTAAGALIIKNSNQITDINDLKNKKVGIAGGSIDKSWLFFRAFFKKKYGEDQFLKWRRGYSTPPPALPIDSEMNPNKDDLYKGINNLPLTECLEDTYARVIPYWENSIKPLVLKNTTIISAHGNSLRALCKYLFDVSDEDITSLEIPTANPLVISLNNSCKIHSASYLDASRAQKLPIIGE